MNDVRVEVSYRLSTDYETRYVIVDAMTGRALACYRWKHEKLRKGMI